MENELGFHDRIAQAQDMYIWEAPAWDHSPRNHRWYLWMTLASLVLVGVAIYTSNYLFALIVLLTSIILVLAGHEEPHRALVQIGPNGIVFDGRFLLFRDMLEFGILYEPPEMKLLYIQPKSPLRPRWRISLEEEDPVSIRNHLKKFVDEDLALRDEHSSDILARMLRL